MMQAEDENSRPSSSETTTTTVANICKFKLVLLGDSSVGKSSLAIRVIKNEFNPTADTTITGYIQQDSTLLKINEGIVELFIWDTAGQERFDSLAPMYYRRAHAALVVYDITCEATFAKAQHWINELKRQAPADIVIALVGNKSDLDHLRQVKQEDAKKYAEENGLLFVEASAKLSDTNVFELFEAVGRRLVESHAETRIDLDNIIITAEDKRNILRRYCCNT